jgi:hypothetical protein
MANSTDFDAPLPPIQRQALLREHFPGWEVWYVPRALGQGMLWYARRDPLDREPLQDTSPSELARRMKAAEAEQADLRRKHVLANLGSEGGEIPGRAGTGHAQA